MNPPFIFVSAFAEIDDLDPDGGQRIGSAGKVCTQLRNSQNALVFVEVKTRKSAQFAKGSDYVDRHKQDRLRITASMYLSQNPTELQPRFDVIEIYAPEGPGTVRPEICHLEDAFQ